MARVTHKRAEEILSKVTDDQAYELGQHGPTSSSTERDRRDFIAFANDMGLNEQEASDLWRYMGYTS